jgi:hypothetical protein
MTTSSLQRMGRRVDAGLHALALRTVAILVANQGAVLPTVVMASVAVGADLLKTWCPLKDRPA